MYTGLYRVNNTVSQHLLLTTTYWQILLLGIYRYTKKIMFKIKARIVYLQQIRKQSNFCII